MSCSWLSDNLLYILRKVVVIYKGTLSVNSDMKIRKTDGIHEFFDSISAL